MKSMELPKISAEMNTRERIKAYIDMIDDEHLLRRIYNYIVALYFK